MKVSQLKENIRNIVRKKLSEATIDVTNPATETPQTKKSKIDIARRITGNKNLGTEKDPVEFIEETGKYTATDIDKMSRAELIDFLGLDRATARNWSDKQLFGAARELADDKETPMDEADYIDDDDIIYEDVEDVDSSGDEMAKYYDEIYEVGTTDDYEFNVAPGSVYQLSVKPHPTRPNLIILSQDNGQEVVVNVEDINSLINILRELT
jgi:hypothetical protein